MGGFSEEPLVDAMTGSEPDAVLGPSKGISMNLVEESDDGSLVVLGALSNCLLLDLSDAALAWVREYDPAQDDSAIIGFSTQHPQALPMRSEVVTCATNGFPHLELSGQIFIQLKKSRTFQKQKMQAARNLQLQRGSRMLR